MKILPVIFIPKKTEVDLMFENKAVKKMMF